MASFDGNGLVIDRLADVKTEIEDELKAAFGTGINLDDRAPWGIIIGILSERYSSIWEIVEAIYEASFPNTSFGVYLEELVAFNGMLKEAATYSTVALQFTRSNDINGGDVTVPAGTQVSAPGDSTVIWVTDAEATILDTTMTISTQATANVIGEVGALAGTLTNLVAGVTNVGSVTNPLDAVLGTDEETDAELKNRRQTELGRSGTSTDSGIRSALQLLVEVRKATLAINDTDFTVGTLPPHSFEAFIATETGFPLGQRSELDWDSDMVTGNSVALTINGNPMAGSPVAFVSTHADTMEAVATVIAAETLVVRATYDVTNNKIDVVGATKTDLTLTAVITGGASQPTVTFSEISAAGDTLETIAQTIWDSKAAGIQTSGIYTGEAVDSSGVTQYMQFSDISDIRLYVRLTLTVDATLYDSGTAEPAIAQALADYGDNNLLPGVDVLNYKLLCAASDVGAAGILDIVCENSLDGVSYAATNRTIDVSEFATIDSGDVSFL
jgi:uncharacterized phage protein gp47/JayE